MALRVESISGMRCAQPGCEREKMWGHFENKAYCQYHYRKQLSDYKEKLILKLLNQVKTALEESPKLTRGIDKDLIELIERQFTKRPTKSKTKIKKESSSAKSEIESLRDELGEIKKLIRSQLPKNRE